MNEDLAATKVAFEKAEQVSADFGDKLRQFKDANEKLSTKNKEQEARIKDLEDHLSSMMAEKCRMELALAEAHAKEAASLKDIMTRVETQHKVNELGRRITDLRGDDVEERKRIAKEVEELTEKAAIAPKAPASAGVSTGEWQLPLRALQ